MFITWTMACEKVEPSAGEDLQGWSCTWTVGCSLKIVSCGEKSQPSVGSKGHTVETLEGFFL